VEESVKKIQQDRLGREAETELSTEENNCEKKIKATFDHNLPNSLLSISAPIRDEICLSGEKSPHFPCNCHMDGGWEDPSPPTLLSMASSVLPSL
jgi:hypothetical protein